MKYFMMHLLLHQKSRSWVYVIVLHDVVHSRELVHLLLSAAAAAAAAAAADTQSCER